VLNASTVVFVEDAENRKLALLAAVLAASERPRAPRAFPHTSNSPCRDTRPEAATDPGCRPPSLDPSRVDDARRRWDAANALDVELDAWARRVRGLDV